MLTVTQEADRTLAVCASTQLLDPQLLEGFFRALDALGPQSGSQVVLDLTSVARMQGTVPGALLRCGQRLRSAGVQLTVCVSSDVGQVLQLLHFDQVFELRIHA